MVLVRDLVGGRHQNRRRETPVCGIEKLSSFQYHLDDMLVAMRLGGFARIR
jgi:hypothetical protein